MTPPTVIADEGTGARGPAASSRAATRVAALALAALVGAVSACGGDAGRGTAGDAVRATPLGGDTIAPPAAAPGAPLVDSLLAPALVDLVCLADDSARAIVAVQLAERSPSRPLDNDEFIEECIGVARQWWLQRRLYSPESISKNLFAGALCLFAVLLIPFFYVMLPLSFLQMEMAYSDESSAWECIRNCYAVARGQRLNMFGLLLINFAIILVGLLACCIGALPAVGLSQLLMAALYLALRRGSEVEPA